MALDNIASLAAARAVKRGAKQPPAGQDGQDGRPIIRIQAGNLHGTVDEAEKALMGLDDGLYKQGQRIVRVVLDEAKVAGGEEEDTPRLSTVSTPHLVERFTAAARFEKWDGRSNDWVPCNCPPNVAEVYAARDGNWLLPFLLGVINAPTLRADGSLLDRPGYDEQTGILFDPLNVKFPTLPTNPSREDAEEALVILKEPLRDFPFGNPASAAVALSGIMTALVRRSLETAPMHAFTAPTAGSGKSLLVDVASVLATGRTASVLYAGDAKFGEELDKKLTGVMLSGSSVISIDNLEKPLQGDLLCQILTQRSIDLRVLGSSSIVSTPSSASVFATGNNLVVVGDLTRRTLIATLAVEDERPELRSFEFNPVAYARQERGRLVTAALTIMMAYRRVERKELQPLGSFEDWSRMVREPLVWLGEADPVDVIEEVRRSDPRLQRLGQMIKSWGAAFGDSPQRIRDAVKVAQRTDSEHSDSYINPDLREALIAVGGDHMSGERIGWWLRKNAGRSVNGVKFTRFDRDNVVPQWYLEGWEGGEGTAAGNGLDLGPAANVNEDIPF